MSRFVMITCGIGVSAICFYGAGNLALQGVSGWGWLLFVGFCLWGTAVSLYEEGVKAKKAELDNDAKTVCAYDTEL